MNYNQLKRAQVIKAAMDDGAKELLQQTLTKEELKNLQEYLKEFCEKTSDTEVKGIQVVEENNPQEFLSDIRSSMFKSLSQQKVTRYDSFPTEFDISERAVCVYGLHTDGRFMLTVSIYNPNQHDQIDDIQEAEHFLEDLSRGVYFDEPLVGYGYESEYENIRRDNPYINNNDLVFEHLKECCGNQSKISANMEDEEWAISFFVTNKTK